MGNFKDEFKQGLHRAGVQDNCMGDCIKWAFGDIPKDKLRTAELMAKWNSLHGDLFKIEVTNDIFETAIEIGRAWVAEFSIKLVPKED